MHLLKFKSVVFFWLTCLSPAVFAQTSLVCFGNEPSWRLTFEPEGHAQLLTKDNTTTLFLGEEKNVDTLDKIIWRGRAQNDSNKKLVALLERQICSDGMSDIKHPFVATVSSPEGDILSGCCRLDSKMTQSATLEQSSWQLVELLGKPLSIDQTDKPIIIQFTSNQIHGHVDCNAFFGDYTLDRDRLTVGALATQLKACPEPLIQNGHALMSIFLKPYSSTLKIEY